MGATLDAAGTVLIVVATWIWWHLVIKWHLVGVCHCERVPLVLSPSQMPPGFGGSWWQGGTE